MEYCKIEKAIKHIYPNAEIKHEKGYKYQIVGENKFFNFYGEKSEDDMINICSDEDGYLFSIINKYL